VDLVHAYTLHRDIFLYLCTERTRPRTVIFFVRLQLTVQFITKCNLKYKVQLWPVGLRRLAAGFLARRHVFEPGSGHVTIVVSTSFHQLLHSYHNLYLHDVEKRKFLTLPGLELRPLSRPACSQSLYRLRYPWTNLYRNWYIYYGILTNLSGEFHKYLSVTPILEPQIAEQFRRTSNVTWHLIAEIVESEETTVAR
jgi:hypothetical protein